MMFYFRRILCAFALAAFLAAPASAEVNSEEFRDKDFNMSSLKTVLALPVIYDVTIPQSEAFFDEKVQQKWRDLTDQGKNDYGFLIKTPNDIIARDGFVKGTSEDKNLTPALTAAKAVRLAPDYADAVLRLTITQCTYRYLHHPEETYWETRYEKHSVRVDGRWTDIEVPIRYQRVKPAWDEPIACASVKLELRGAKTNALIYGNQTTGQTGEGFFSSTPTLIAETSNVMTRSIKKFLAAQK